jgi:type IV pilus assembly protein PilC
MVRAGLPLDRGLQILSQQTQNNYFRGVILDIEDNLRKGHTFSDSLQKYSNVFPEIFINMVKVGETSGNLEEVLMHLALQMEKDHELRSRIRGAMIYPAVIVCVMVGIGILMMTMVIPKLADTFKELDADLPWTTKMVIATSDFMAANVTLTLLILAAAVVLTRLLLKTEGGKQMFDFFVLKIPPFSTLSRKINSARFARNLCALIDAGVPIMNALQIVSKTLSNIYFKQSLADSAKQIQKGEPLSKILQQFEGLYPVIVVQMIQVGETTGSMSEILKNLADFYEEEVSNATKNLSSIIEPVLMVVIGIIVGFFAISMIQPLYSMMEHI